MNLNTIKCFICSTDFKTNRTFTLVSLGTERLWFCNRHIPQKTLLQHLSDDDVLSKLVNQKKQFAKRLHPRFDGAALSQWWAKKNLFFVGYLANAWVLSAKPVILFIPGPTNVAIFLLYARQYPPASADYQRPSPPDCPRHSLSVRGTRATKNVRSGTRASNRLSGRMVEHPPDELSRGINSAAQSRVLCVYKITL